jgi:hypothetical protein
MYLFVDSPAEQQDRTQALKDMSFLIRFYSLGALVGVLMMTELAEREVPVDLAAGVVAAVQA